MKLSIDKIKPNSEKPRFIKDDAFKKLVKSIKDFPEMLEAREIVVNKDYVILGGNMRYKALKAAGITEAPVKIVDWSEKKQQEFIVKDNVSGGQWDWDILANQYEMEELEAWGLDLPVYDEADKDIDEESYSKKIEAPVYEITGNKPEIKDLYNYEYREKLKTKINESEVSGELKDFLLSAAARHTVFNYANIAEFYAHSKKQVQELFEESGLVIIDFDKAIEYGFIKLSDESAKQYTDENK